MLGFSWLLDQTNVSVFNDEKNDGICFTSQWCANVLAPVSQIIIMDSKQITQLMTRKQKFRNRTTKINTMSMSVAITGSKMNENYLVGG